MKSFEPEYRGYIHDLIEVFDSIVNNKLKTKDMPKNVEALTYEERVKYAKKWWKGRFLNFNDWLTLQGGESIKFDNYIIVKYNPIA